jgi:uncharacterized protein (DUF433 family)
MAVIKAGYQHIVLNDLGVPFIAGTTMKVIELVLDHAAYGWSAEELRFQHPQLLLGQIHSALTYYWEHKDALDADIAQRQARVAELRRTTPVPPLVNRLRAQKSPVLLERPIQATTFYFHEILALSNRCAVRCYPQVPRDLPHHRAVDHPMFPL